MKISRSRGDMQDEEQFPLTFTASTFWPKEKIVQDCVLLCPDGVADALPGFAGLQGIFLVAVF